MSTPSQTGFSRVFTIPDGARADHTPVYMSCARAGALGQAFGDITPIECPDPHRQDGFITVGEVKAAEGLPTTSIVSRYVMDTISSLLDAARRGCPMDVQIHFGMCSDPSLFNTFAKAVILESARVTNWASDDLGALESGERGAINETADLTARSMYEVVPLSFSRKADDIVTTELLDVILCDTPACTNGAVCASPSSGCDKIYAVTKAAGGSPSTPADVVFSLNGGKTWYAHDIDTMSSANDATAIACVGNYLVAISTAENALFYTPKASLDGIQDPLWTKVATGFVANKAPLDICSLGSYAYIAGQGGYIYKLTDPALGVTVVSAGAVTVNNLMKISFASESFGVIVGASGAVIYTEDGGASWEASNVAPVGVGVNLYAVYARDSAYVLVGGTNGRLYYTLNQGSNWAEIAFPGSGSGSIYDIAFATRSVGYLAHNTAAPRGRILRTFDGGASWVVLPENVQALPLTDRITALAVCAYNPNFVVGVGLADDAADGAVLLGVA